MAYSLIIELSGRIAANTARIKEYLASHDLAEPSFDTDAPLQSDISRGEMGIEAARQAVIHDCSELRVLMLGPKEQMASYQNSSAEFISQHAILRFKLAEAFPVYKETTFKELATTSGLSEVHVRKLLRLAMTQHIFCEPRPGVVAHTAASRLLAEDKGLSSFLRYRLDDLWPAATQTVNAMTKWPGSEEPAETGFALANQTKKDLFQFYKERPERSERFSAAMRFYTERPGLEPAHLVENHAWDQIAEGGTVVDVGGSHGVISIELARKYPKLHFIVQELDERVIHDAEQQRPDEVSDRVRFMQHDFFTEQPVCGAEVYFFRAIFHDWSDTYAVKILRSLVPALKPGAKIVLNEPVVPEPGAVPAMFAPGLRAHDLSMVAMTNGGERELLEWQGLFAKASSGFRFLGGKQPPGSALWIMVAEWTGV
ncbi:putative O-methyltransferase [Xylariaceae sp. FL0016]|nr:putative O-methyltransferase [Xylariaceae sp. FL0016]